MKMCNKIPPKSLRFYH